MGSQKESNLLKGFIAKRNQTWRLRGFGPFDVRITRLHLPHLRVIQAPKISVSRLTKCWG